MIVGLAEGIIDDSRLVYCCIDVKVAAVAAAVLRVSGASILSEKI